MTWTDDLRRLGACEDAILWAETQPDIITAWRTCPRGDWMVWLIARTAADLAARRRVVLLLVEGWRSWSAGHVSAGETRPGMAVDLAARWAGGEDVSAVDLLEAAAEATEAAEAAAAAWTAAAAEAWAAWVAARTAAWTAAAAWAAETAAEAAELARWADLVRAGYPDPPEIGETGAPDEGSAI